MDRFKMEFIDDARPLRWRKWSFDDSGITIEEKWDEEATKRMDNGRLVHYFLPYGKIVDINFERIGKNLVINVSFYLYFEDLKRLKYLEQSISSEHFERRNIKSAVSFAKKQSKKNSTSSEKIQIFKKVTQNKFTAGEYIMLCETCGQTFRYTDADLRKNVEIREEANKLQKEAFFDAIALNPLLSTIDSQRADEKLKTMTDYSSCPKCKSSKLKRITEEELAQLKERNNSPVSSSSTSSADEIKKFKELLDSGVITQEEFDAKKKQLLGL